VSPKEGAGRDEAIALLVRPVRPRVACTEVLSAAMCILLKMNSYGFSGAGSPGNFVWLAGVERLELAEV